MHNALSEFVPEAMGCGSYASNPNIHFFIYELVNMTDEIPQIQARIRLLAELHTRGTSPNGKYGFEGPTYKGSIPQYKKWHDTWEEAFHRVYRGEIPGAR